MGKKRGSDMQTGIIYHACRFMGINVSQHKGPLLEVIGTMVSLECIPGPPISGDSQAEVVR